jgi:hypothetical protein
VHSASRVHLLAEFTTQGSATVVISVVEKYTTWEDVELDHGIPPLTPVSYARMVSLA